MKCFYWSAISFFSLSLAAQTPQKPRVEVVSPMLYGETGNYKITKPDFVYRGQFENLAEIDVKNFVVHSFEGKRHLVCGQLRGGYWESHEGRTLDSLRFVGSYPLPSDDLNSEFLLVLVDYYGVGGSSESSGLAQVWKLSNGTLRIEQQIDYNTHFGGNGQFQKFSSQNKQFVVRASHYLPGDAHCCISAYDELTFRWSGSEYVLTRIETKRVPKVSERDSASKKN